MIPEAPLPLSEEEIDELDAFLLSDSVPDDAMDASMLDGFLTAIVVGPNNLPPSLWLPLVWGHSITWASQTQAKRMTSLVLRHANDLLFVLRSHPDEFEPLLFVDDASDDGRPLIDDWCTGFVRGMGLDEAAWRPLLDTEAGSELLLPMLLHGTEEGWQQLLDNPDLHGQQQAYADMLGDNVVAIMDWWLPTRKANSTIRRDAPKVGRNDPCPCGSGKKFKHCCEHSGTLH